MVITIKQGETVKIETSVLDVDGEVADLSGATVVFALKRKGVDTVVTKVPTITGNKLSITLNTSDTSIVGEYSYEFRMKLNSEEDSLDMGRIKILKALVYGL